MFENIVPIMMSANTTKKQGSCLMNQKYLERLTSGAKGTQRNSMVLAAIFVCLAFLISGCQTTFGLSAPPADTPLTIPETTYFLVYGSNDSPRWAEVLSEFSPEVHTAAAKYIDDPDANFVFLRSQRTEPFLMNLLLIPGGLTLFIIPGFGYETYTADFEVYPAQNRTHSPTKLHYEFSSIRGVWLLNPASIRADSSSSVRALYRQFFADYAKLLNNSKVMGEKHE